MHFLMNGIFSAPIAAVRQEGTSFIHRFAAFLLVEKDNFYWLD